MKAFIATSILAWKPKFVADVHSHTMGHAYPVKPGAYMHHTGTPSVIPSHVVQVNPPAS